MKNIKTLLKKNKLIYEIASSYIVRDDYGYLRSKGEVSRFLKRLDNISDIYEYDPSKKDIFIFIGDKNKDSTLRVAVFGDIDEGNCKKECKYYTTRELVDDKLKKIHKIYFDINKRIPLPFKYLWEYKYTTNALHPMKNYNMFVIFMGGAYYEETFSQPQLFKKIHNFAKETFCKKILYLVDPIDKYPTLPYWFPYFDIIASYSMEDKLKYNTIYIDSPCVKFKNINSDYLNSDIYFRGMDAGRAAIIDSCYYYLNSAGIKCDFHVQTKSAQFISRKGMEFSNTRVSYRKTIEEELSANVLMEVLIPGVGSGPTLRTKEAVMYNKKLLTNNPRAKENEFFSSGNIHYFEKVSDIDVDWVKDSSKVEYGYRNEYSTDVFLDKIKNIFVKQST